MQTGIFGNKGKIIYSSKFAYTRILLKGNKRGIYVYEAYKQLNLDITGKHSLQKIAYLIFVPVPCSSSYKQCCFSLFKIGLKTMSFAQIRLRDSNLSSSIP